MGAVGEGSGRSSWHGPPPLGAPAAAGVQGSGDAPSAAAATVMLGRERPAMVAGEGGGSQ